MKEDKKNKKPEKGVTIPAGTEQETGLTRGQTEKLPDPETPLPPYKKKSGDDESLIYKN
jgi:hypothetical protein